MNSPIGSEHLVNQTMISPAPDEVIRLTNVSVRYHVPRERISTFKEYAIRKIQGKVSKNTFWALKSINLSVFRGEVFGIIGQNGAGKSTLLKLIARVLQPTEGRVWVKGNVVPLLEIGAGFHPDLTGRENIYLNGAILGFKRNEMKRRIDNIIEFSELGDFIEAPIRTYSTGMWARLGFSIATEVTPDILILDEVIGVGDEAFQKKCAKRIETFRDNGTTILLVSHDTQMIESLCQRAVWLDHGTIQAMGSVSEVVRAYHMSHSQ